MLLLSPQHRQEQQLCIYTKHNRDADKPVEMFGVLGLYGPSCHRQGALLSVYVLLIKRNREQEKSCRQRRLALVSSVTPSLVCCNALCGSELLQIGCAAHPRFCHGGNSSWVPPAATSDFHVQVLAGRRHQGSSTTRCSAPSLPAHRPPQSSFSLVQMKRPKEGLEMHTLPLAAPAGEGMSRRVASAWEPQTPLWSAQGSNAWKRKTQATKTSFCQRMKLPICKVASSSKGSLGNGCVLLWTRWGCAAQGNAVEAFVICCNSPLKAKQGKNQGQEPAGPQRTALHLRRSIGLGRVRMWPALGSGRMGQKGRGQWDSSQK